MKRGPASGRRAALAALPLLAACAHAPPTTVAPAAPAPPHAAAAEGAVRYVHGNPEESFWVSRAPGLDRVVTGGARLEVGPGGEISAAAWDENLTALGEPITGALAVPDRLGGGHLVWTRAHVFRAREFTGPLVPVPLGVSGHPAVRGARAGLSSVLVFTESGPRELLPGAARLTPLKDPALLDLAALSAQRAARLDVFGRLAITGDGGARWTDLSPRTGSFVKQISVGPSELWIDDPQGRFLVDPSGRLDPADPPDRSLGYDQPRAFQIAWRNARERDDWPWALRESSPLAVAVAAGAAVGDGTAFGVVPGALLRVELATGELLVLATDALPGGLLCQPLRAPDGVLLACVWERSQGYGGYVLRSVRGGPLEIDKAFSDDGSFVASDDGALGYVGSCRAEPRHLDPNDQSRWEVPAETSLRPVLCVRRGPREWVERRADPGEGASLVAWVPRLDGTAAALASSSDPLPPPVGARRVLEQGGVRLVRVYPEVPGSGWGLRRASWQSERAGLSGYVDRRFRITEDGSIDAWLLPATDGRGPVDPLQGTGDHPQIVGVTLDPSGIPTVHPAAPGAVEVVSGGSFAVAIARDGALHESTDHGRTWRPAGRSPVPPGSAAGHACSALGCTFGAVVRAGWGDPALAPRISSEPVVPPETPPLPRLSCAPRGAPIPVSAPPPAPAGTRHTVSTGWGDTLEIVRDGAVPEPPPGPVPPPPSGTVRLPPVPTPAPPKKPPRASPAVLRTHTLLARQPFAPLAAPRRLNATDASFNIARRTLVVPLLAPSGEVDMLVSGDQTELLVSGDRISVVPAFEPRRYVWGEGAGVTGIALPGGRALVLGEMRRRLALEDHGPGPAPPPLFLGMERGSLRRRPLAIARRDDGTLGVIVVDGGGPETAGVAVLDRLAGSLGPTERLAPWSTVLAADDPRCKKGADPRAWQALFVIDPATWLALDGAALPGIALAHQGLMRVRWGAAHVCLEALDTAATDANRRGEVARSWTLVARWSGEKDRGAALRTGDLQQALVCRVGAAEGEGEGR